MNVDLTHQILDGLGKPPSLIKPVPDRPGHDRRYCLDTTKLRVARLGAAGAVRRRAARNGRMVPGERVVVAPDQGAGSELQVVLPGPVRNAALTVSILVTGAAGFAGSHVVQILAGRDDVVGWMHRANPPDDIARLATWQRVDLLNRCGGA